MIQSERLKRAIRGSKFKKLAVHRVAVLCSANPLRKLYHLKDLIDVINNDSYQPFSIIFFLYVAINL